jgi:hypothetical protein
MKRVMWILLAIAALLWTAMAWLLHSLAGSGEAAVLGITRWLQIDPTSTIWLADILGAIGGPTQVLIWIGWAIGMAALGLVGWFGSRVANEAANVSRGIQESRAPTVEGQIRERSVASAPPPPERPFDG